MLRILAPLLLILSCSTKKIEKKGRLFPYGTYEQEITMVKEGKKLTFPAITLWTKAKFSLEVLDKEKKTLIKYDEDLKAYKKTVFIDHDRVPLTDEKAIFYFSYLKFIYSLDRSICEKNVCKYAFMGQEFYFDLDAEAQVKHIRMKRSDKEMNVEVLKYQSLKD